MDGKKVLGIVLVLLGLFYALAPHAMHVSSGLGFGLEHMWHVTLGVVLLLGGAYYGWMMHAKAARPARARSARRRRR